ncbi:Cytoskeleton protein RodZ [compost metagenome]
MKKTGEILRKAREEKGLSLNEIGLSLKISSKVLKAIEEGNERQLPAKTFLRGFVQSYANYLHLDTDKILEIFYEEMGSTRPKPYIRENEDGTPVHPEGTEATVTPISAKAAASRKADNLAPLQQAKNTKTVAAVIVGFILVALIIFTKKMIDKYSKEAEVPSAEVEQTMEGATPVSPSTEAESSDAGPETPAEVLTSEPRSTPVISSQASPAPIATPVVVASPSVTPKPSPTVTPKASPTVTPTPTPKATATPSPSPVASAFPSPSPVAAAAVASPTPAVSPTPTAGKPVELIVEAFDNVEIEYAAPNGKMQKIKLSAEQVHTFKSKSGLKINFSNGGAVNLILNGKDLGIPGDLGKPIKLSY